MRVEAAAAGESHHARHVEGLRDEEQSMVGEAPARHVDGIAGARGVRVENEARLGDLASRDRGRQPLGFVVPAPVDGAATQDRRVRVCAVRLLGGDDPSEKEGVGATVSQDGRTTEDDDGDAF